MNTEERNMMLELIDQLKGNRTLLRALLNLALDHNKMLVPFVSDALRQNDDKIERALELIDRRYR